MNTEAAEPEFDPNCYLCGLPYEDSIHSKWGVPGVERGFVAGVEKLVGEKMLPGHASHHKELIKH